MSDFQTSLNKFLKTSIILCLTGWSLFYSLRLAIDIPTSHLDGAFQTASGLFRINSGQYPGQDFFPYIGIGPIAILFPTFRMFGGNLASSVVAAQFVTLLGGILSTTLIFHLAWRSKSFLTTITAGAILFIAPIAAKTFFSYEMPGWVAFSVYPGNSLRPIRALAPYLMVVFYYIFIIKINNQLFKYILAGMLNALILLWSNDYAVPCAGLFGLFIVLDFLNRKILSLKNLLLYFTIVIVTFVALSNLATNGNSMSLIKYNFFDVAKDQWWIFGPYGEALRIFNLQQIYKLFSKENYLPLIVLVLIGILAFKTHYLQYTLLLWIGLVLFAGGVVASVGGHLGGYFDAFYFWGAVTLIAILTHFMRLGAQKLFQQRIDELIIRKSFLLAFLIGSFVAMLTSISTYQASLSNAKNDHNRFYVPELGGYLSRQWLDYIKLIRNTASNEVIEEYWGLWSATRNIVSDWPVDSVISALGSTRVTAANKLKDAHVIVSTRYTTAPQWQPWNLSQNYWFYEELIKHWTPHDVSPTTVVWLKNTNPRAAFNRIGCSVDEKLKRLILSAPASGFYELEMNYSLAGQGRFLLMAKNNISFGADADGYVSLDPKGSVTKFPVYISQAGLNSLEIKVTGPFVHDLRIRDCDAHQISMVNSNVLHVRESFTEEFFLTDGNWKRGIALNWAGFFVPSISKFIDIYKPGRKVSFLDGNARKIIRIERNGEYINVFLDGDPLISEKVGLPSEFVVTDIFDSNSDKILSNNSNISHVSGSREQDFFVTDGNWERGVARNWAGFYVPSIGKFSDIYKPGRKVQFPNGDVRQIVRIERNGEYLNIFLDGIPLNPAKVGLPTSFVVFDINGNILRIGEQ